jgi:hypothetical protein
MKIKFPSLYNIMNKLNKTHGMFILFVLLILVLVIKPSVVKNMYSSFLGRLLLVAIVIFFAMNTMTLGLLTALVFIIFSNMIFFKEGLDNMDTTTDTNTDTSTKAVTNKKQEDKEPPIDLETIKNSIQSKPSSSLPTASPGSSEDVAPATQESFQSMYGAF